MDKMFLSGELRDRWHTVQKMRAGVNETLRVAMSLHTEVVRELFLDEVNLWKDMRKEFNLDDETHYKIVTNHATDTMEVVKIGYDETKEAWKAE